MVLVITQETYDEVVKENIEEFDMSPEDAVKEAIAQFEAQGVDLANIIKDLSVASGDGHLVTKTIETLKKFESTTDDILNKELQVLQTECRKDIAHRMKAGKDGAYPVLISILQTKMKAYSKEPCSELAKTIINVINTLEALMDIQPDYLDVKGLDAIFCILKGAYPDDMKAASLRWVTTCCVKHEMNRLRFYGNGIAECLNEALNNPKLLSESLSVIRKFTLDDDIRVEFGKAPEHAKEFGFLMLANLTKLLKENTEPPLVSELLLTIACLLVRHELCKLVADHGGSTVLFTVLTNNYETPAVINQANKLITALAGNDDVKHDLVKNGIAPILVSILGRYSSNATVAAYTLKSISALTLREPGHSKQFLDTSAVEAIVECMKIHTENSTVQKHGCWAIRNLVARCRDYNAKFRELGIEDILKGSLDKCAGFLTMFPFAVRSSVTNVVEHGIPKLKLFVHMLQSGSTTFGAEFGFDIKSALRDLECDVKLDEQWRGTGVEIQRD